MPVFIWTDFIISRETGLFANQLSLWHTTDVNRTGWKDKTGTTTHHRSLNTSLAASFTNGHEVLIHHPRGYALDESVGDFNDLLYVALQEVAEGLIDKFREGDECNTLFVIYQDVQFLDVQKVVTVFKRLLASNGYSHLLVNNEENYPNGQGYLQRYDVPFGVKDHEWEQIQCKWDIFSQFASNNINNRIECLAL